jgi:hypothetical protein
MDVTTRQAPHVAPQQSGVTIRPAACRPLWVDHPAWKAPAASRLPMTTPPPHQRFIQGVTREGKAFRPSDWAERLAGAMASFRPEGSAGGIGAFIGYSPYCVPRVIDGIKCVIVDDALRGLEPMAWDFVMHFARDNDLVVVEPDEPGA